MTGVQTCALPISRGASFPYAAFSSEQEANTAREAIIKELESSARDVDALDSMNALEGPLENQIRIREVEVKDEFGGDTEDFFVESP